MKSIFLTLILLGNENTNRLLREYFPKGRDLTLVDDENIQLLENKLNNRPRKYLNWKNTLWSVLWGKFAPNLTIQELKKAVQLVTAKYIV